MERKILEKMLVTILIITLVATDFFMLGANLVSYAADLSKSTNNNNIEFSTYFKNAEGKKIDTINGDINNENIKMYAEIAVKKEGYFNGTIELVEGNFDFKNISSNKNVSSIQDNKITLNQINAGDTVEIEIGVDPLKTEQMDLSQLTMSSKIKLTGTYMETSYKGKDISAEKMVKLNLIMDEENTTAEINNEIITNKVFNINGENKKIVQMLVRTKITDNNYPVQQTTITANVPEKNKEKLQKIEVLALRTPATNGLESNLAVVSSSTENGEQIKNVQVKVENKGDTISWKKGTADEYVITYVYDEDTNTNGTELKVNAEIEVYNTSTKFSKEATVTVDEKELSEIVVSEIKMENTETYKGQLYANTKSNNKKEIVFNTTTNMIVRASNIAEKINVKEEEDTFTGAEINANTRYLKSYVNKNEMIAMLGQDGYVEIISNGTNYRLTKDSDVDENGNIVVEYGEDARGIEINTSKPLNAGILSIKHEKAIMASDYITEQIKSVTGLRAKNISTMKATINTTLENGVQEAGEKIADVISKNEITAEKPLKETYSKAELTVNKTNLSTMATNSGVILGVKFITNGTQYDLYKNPTVKIQLPQEVTDVKVKGIDKLYGDEFSVAKAIYNKQSKTIEIELNGEQKEYATNDATQLYLQINLDMTVEQTSASKTEKITMTYTNQNATRYENDGIVERTIGISAPSGIIAINKLNTYNINSVAGINQDKQVIDLDKDIVVGTSAEYQISVVNNTGNTINNVKILGNFPTTGEINRKNDDIINTLETNVIQAINAGNAKVYYSENDKATTDLKNAENGWTQDTSKIATAKIYLIDLGTMEVGASYTTGYTSKIAENIDYDLISYAGYKVIYNEEGSNQEQTVESTLVGMTTEGGLKVEDIKTETRIEATVGKTELKDGDTVKAGEVIKYKVTTKNVGERKLKDVTIKGNIPDGTVAVEPEQNYKDTDSYYTEKTDIKEVSKTIESIEPGQEYTMEYSVRVNTNVTSGSEISSKAIVECGEYKQESNEMKLKLAEAKIRVTLKKLAEDDVDKVLVGEYMEYMAYVENTSSETVKDLTLEIKTTGAEIVGIDDIEGNEIEKSNSIKINEIKPNEKVGYGFTIKITNDATKQFETSVTVKDANGNEYRANDVELVVYQGSAKVKLSTPNNGDYVEAGDQVIYNIEVANTEKNIETIKICDEIPSELEIQEIIYAGETVMQNIDYDIEDTFSGNISNSVNYTAVLQPSETAEMTIITKVKENKELSENKTIKNSVEIKINDNTVAKSEEVSHIIKGTVREEMKNIISGVAWLDTNTNGQKDTDEVLLSGITVRLLDVKTNKLAVDKEGKALETKTGEDGKYIFSKVDEGQYVVVFEYDTTKYEPTDYMKQGVSEGLNSKAIAKTFDGEVKGNAGTDTIDLKESIFNINIGLKQNLKFDLELGKYISKIVIQNNKGTKTYESKADETFKKVEIPSKQVDDSVAVIEYTIRVKNTGEVAGYVTNIRDYLPNGLVFSSELNPDWYISGEDLYTKSLANARIEPGEVKEIKLVLTKTMSSGNVGLINNRAEIAESYNELGKNDIDSTANNQVKDEDDLGSADVIIGVSTGITTTLYAILVIINTILIGFVIYLVFRKSKIK